MPDSPGPAVSVVMSVHDGERFLHEAVGSILAQTLTELELVVVDDGSSDRSRQILGESTDPRMRVIEQEHAGLAAALNRGVGAARADLVARMDADDIALPRRLEEQWRFMQSHPQTALLGTGARVIDHAGEEVGLWRPLTDHASIRRRLIRLNQFAHPTVMFRRAAFVAAGGYREDMPFAQDYDLWLRMVARFEAANLGEVLLVRRVGPDQFGTARETRQIRWALRARLDALRRGDYPARDALGLLRPLVAAVLPGPVRQLGRSAVRRRRA